MELIQSPSETLVTFMCENLEQAGYQISDKVQNIGNDVFRRCSKLTTITFNNNIKAIGVDVFVSCGFLKTVVLNEGLEKVIGNSFWSSGIKNNNNIQLIVQNK